MPSPFPGMDPFLEHPALFPGLHGRFIAYLSETLQDCLPGRYYADFGQRVWVEISRRRIEPDVYVMRRKPQYADVGGAWTALAVAPPVPVKPVSVRVAHDERRETFVEIREQGDRLVTSIELLSLTNKSPGEEGRDLYLRKQRELLTSRAHLVEIDLLRGGQHTTAVPRADAVEKTGPFDYHVCVHRFDSPTEFLVYPVMLAQPLPAIEIPLLPEDPPVPISLQDILNRSYDKGPYRRRVIYHELDIVPPLSGEQLQWAKGILTEKGIPAAPQIPPTPGSP